MPTLHSHTHCQAAPASAQTKVCKRACFSPTHKIVLKKFPTLQKN